MKQKKKPISNNEIINKLACAGLIPESRFGKQLQSTYYTYDPHYESKHYVSYKIPIDIYKNVIGVRFTSPLKVGNIVRFKSSTDRINQRQTYAQDVGNIYDWDHLGIGSGKCYIDMEQFKTNKNTYLPYYIRLLEHNVLTIGQRYVLNPYSAYKSYNEYKSKNYGVKNSPKQTYNEYLEYHHCCDTTTLKPDGLFGPKQLINGYITDVYVHFVYPKWKYKREARYQVMFDTGANGIFTSDRLERVFDTDFEVDEKYNVCDRSGSVMHCRLCDHRIIHTKTKECKEICFANNDAACQPALDFTQLHETTIQRGYIDEDEDENDGGQ